MDQYLKIVLPITPEHHELLMAELSILDYDSFQENDTDLHAYILQDQFNETSLKQVLERYNLPADFLVEKLDNVNWNAQWESNFQPVYIGGQVQIRADFHEPKTDFEYDVIVNPKMSFGTGHHETTHLMVAEQLQLDHRDKQVLDVGTGTGVLAIMANKLGARSIIATDIDEWSIDNCKENFAANQVQNIDILKGSIHNLTLAGEFNIIYANINKNVLIDELPSYARLLAESGMLVLSGFYSEDMEDLVQLGSNHGLKAINHQTKNNWALLRLSSNNI